MIMQEKSAWQELVANQKLRLLTAVAVLVALLIGKMPQYLFALHRFYYLVLVSLLRAILLESAMVLTPAQKPPHIL